MNTTKNDLVKQDANARNVHNETREENWQEVLVSDKSATILAASFYNASGELIESYQLICKGKAVAIADFRAGKLERFDCIPDGKFKYERWLANIRATSDQP